MSTLFSYLLLLLLGLFLAGQFLGRGGFLESLRRLSSKGAVGIVAGMTLFLAGFLIWRTLGYLNEEREKWITRGMEPGDTVSLGFDTKSRFVSMSQPLGRVFDRNGQLLAGYVVDDHHLRRYYPAGNAAAHLVGYWTGPVRDGVGVEKGLVYLNDSLRDDRPHDVTLSLDLRLQKEALEALGGREGAIVVLDATNGEVLTAASLPTFDPNRVREKELWKSYVTAEETRPLISRAVKDNFSPGSSIKPLVAAAALSYGATLPEQENFVCTGEYRPAPGIKPISDHGASHGRVDLSSAMRVSCNTYFSRLAYGEIGFDRMRSWLESLGANRRMEWNTGIFLNEYGALGLAPSTVNAADEIAKSRIGIGQASVKFNPVHAAVMFAGIGEGGRFFAPSLERGRVPDTLRWPLTAQNAQSVAELLLEPLKRGGTAPGVFNGLGENGITVFGKTGTADREPDGRAPSWFSSFGEKNGRRYAVIVVIANRRGKYAGGLNAPIARHMYESLSRLGYFDPVPGGQPTTNDSTE